MTTPFSRGGGGGGAGMRSRVVNGARDTGATVNTNTTYRRMGVCAVSEHR